MARGFSSLREASEAIEKKKERAQSGGSPQQKAIWFKLGPGESTTVRFLEQDEEVSWTYAHDVQLPKLKFPSPVACLDQNDEGTPCPGCEAGLAKKVKGYINVIWEDAPEFEYGADGRMVRGDDRKPVVLGNSPQVAIWSSGVRLFTDLTDLDANYRGLSSRKFKVTRKGEGLQTKYSIMPEDPDAGRQEFDSLESRLYEEKYDLSFYTDPPTYQRFEEMLEGGEVQDNDSYESKRQEASRNENPFMRRR